MSSKLPSAPAAADSKNPAVTPPPAELAELAWKEHVSRHRSTVHTLFWCQTQTKVVCPECKSTKLQFDPANVLAFPIPDERKRAMDIGFVPLDLALVSALSSVRRVSLTQSLTDVVCCFLVADEASHSVRR